MPLSHRRRKRAGRRPAPENEAQEGKTGPATRNPKAGRQNDGARKPKVLQEGKPGTTQPTGNSMASNTKLGRARIKPYAAG